VIGCGTIVRFTSAPDRIGDIPIKSLVEFDSQSLTTAKTCVDCKQDAPVEHVRFCMKASRQ